MRQQFGFGPSRMEPSFLATYEALCAGAGCPVDALEGAGTVEIQRNFIGGQVVRGATTVSAGWRNPLR